MFGYASSELMGQPLTILIPERYQAGHGRGLARAGAADALRAAARSSAWTACAATAASSRISVAVGRAERGRRPRARFTAILKDITHQVAIEDELRRSEQAQRQLAKEQTALAAEHAALRRVATAVARGVRAGAGVRARGRGGGAAPRRWSCVTVGRYVRDDELLVHRPLGRAGELRARRPARASP